MLEKVQTFDYIFISKIYYKFSYYLCCSPFKLIEKSEKVNGEKFAVRRNLLQNVIKNIRKFSAIFCIEIHNNKKYE